MAKITRSLSIATFVFVIWGVAGAGLLYAQTEEYKEYTVQKGDTLWDISSKEVIDPFLWPKVWKENPDVKNPDLIYPGQKIRIPLSLLQKQVPPPPVEKAMPSAAVRPPVREAKREEPVVKVPLVRKEYLVDRDTYISAGYITDIIDSKGEVLGAPSEQTLLGQGDYAYVRTAQPAKAGEKFYIIRSFGKVKHPETGKMMGYLIDVRGIAEVVGKESGETKVRITNSFSDVLVGDLLTDFFEMDPPFLTGNPRTPDIAGFIVATKQRHVLNGQLDLVYLDRGRKDGLEIGDIFAMTARAKYEVPNGYLQVISMRESTSTAVVRKASKEVSSGDKTRMFSPPQ
ncbi:MAG: LysM peptidoglycan-binding domain-containing protein [Nitrospirae bacterium]|nr:LysM peptidoglycan-binding domain-containing protein [Nitrospirota bacterium]